MIRSFAAGKRECTRIAVGLFCTEKMKLLKLVFSLVMSGLAALLFFNAACTNFNAGLFKGNSNTDLSPTTKKTPVIIDGRIINETGWKIPQTKDTDKGTPIVKKINSVEGKPFEVKKTYYTPNNEVLYTEELFSENVTRLHGELVLSSFEEFRLNDKIYLYLIVAKENESINQRNVNDHNDKLIYQILDSDGDGIFETLIDNDSTVLIPKWATEKR